MLGMLQILTWLLCVYLVFKGVEILQIALAPVSRGFALFIGVAALLASIALAGWFGTTADEQARHVSSSTSVPR